MWQNLTAIQPGQLGIHGPHSWDVHAFHPDFSIQFVQIKNSWLVCTNYLVVNSRSFYTFFLMFKVHNWFAHGKTAWLYWELFGLKYSIDKLLGMCIQFNISPAPPKIIEFRFIGRVVFLVFLFCLLIMYAQRNWLVLSSYWNVTLRLGPFLPPE